MVACIPSWYRGRKSEFSPNFKGPSDKAGGQGHAGTLLSPSPPPGRRQGAPTLLSTNPSPRSLPNRRYHRCRPRWRWAPEPKGVWGGGGGVAAADAQGWLGQCRCGSWRWWSGRLPPCPSRGGGGGRPWILATAEICRCCGFWPYGSAVGDLRGTDMRNSVELHPATS
jgi:hypothetical protein